MPTKLTRFSLTFTKAQLKSLKLRFPSLDIRDAIYAALGFDPPKHGGKRKGAGRKSGKPGKSKLGGKK